MPSAADILNDPNYINANAATKRAIFERRVMTLPEYRNANPATQAAIRQRFKVETPKPKPKPRQRGLTFRGNEPLTTTIDVINETLLGGVEGAYNLGAMLTDPIAGLFATPEQMKAAREQRRNFFNEVSRNLATQERPIAREIGKVIAPAGAVGRGATLAAPLVRQLPRVGPAAERIVRAAGTGGIGSGRTAAQTAAATRTQRLGQLGERMVGGGAGAAATAALSGQPVAESAAFGAGLPIVGSVLKRVAGFTGDITKLPRQKAAEIIRKSLGENLEEARAAFAALPADDRRLAEQVLLDAGVEPDTFYGLGGIAQRELQTPGANPMRETLEQQAAAREARLAGAARGATQEEVRAAAREGRSAVSREMGPLRESAFAQGESLNRLVPEAERLAQTARTQADEITESGIVPRMRGLETRSLEQLDAVFQNPEMFTTGRTVQRIGEIADQAGRRADEGIDAQLGLRDAARDMDDLINDLAAEGLRPLRAAPLVQDLQRRLADPAIAVDDLQNRTLKGLLRKINAATDKNGMLDPRALGQIRKTGINDLVEGWMGSVSRGAAPSSGNLQRASSLSLGLRDLIDSAMPAPWQEYLRRSELGYAAVNRGELAGEALRLYKQDPANAKKFLELVGGDMPKTVGKIMGGGAENESFAGVMVNDPARLQALQQSAQEMIDLNRMRELRASGASPAANLMIRERPSVFARGLAAATLSPFPSVRIGATGAEQVERAVMAPRVQREIAGAFTSGPAMRNILNTFRGPARISEQISRLPASVRNAFAQALIQQGVGPNETVAPMIGEGALNEYDEFGNPLFDERGNYIGPR